MGDVGVASGQIQARVLPSMTKPFEHAWNQPILGHGIGMGSNVGAQRLGVDGFVLGENSWEVVFGELGPVLGYVFVFWRIALVIWLLRLALQAARRGNQVPLILAGCSLFSLLQGQLNQPTGLGFIVLTSGLTLAACNSNFPKPAVVRDAIPMTPGSSFLPTA